MLTVRLGLIPNIQAPMLLRLPWTPGLGPPALAPREKPWGVMKLSHGRGLYGARGLGYKT